MVWDALLWRGHCQDGDGQLQQCKSILLQKIVWYYFIMLLYLTVDLFSFQRKYTQQYEDIKDQIYFMQTDTPVYDANKKARIAASEVSPHKHTHKRYCSIFKATISCGRHDREMTDVSEQSVSQQTESPLTQGRPRYAHTCSAWLGDFTCSQHQTIGCL